MTHIHDYDPDPNSNAGNCRCGLHLESHRHPHPFTQSYRSNTCICAQPASAPIHTDADTARPNPVYPEPQASSSPRSFAAAREAVRQARGDEASPQTPILFSDGGEQR
ncbi:hypothetical protein [Streptomyces ipomoeae]|uniref:hypothetical protein n=1 Tax=Streptomyces ipomoeae TaxID=103232 RepID=UPI0029AF3B41|nr:hypothetical protein [Streptomyces ipomoeae]MDX2697576.1 hypothetical protein [Streptomyces ipomoeae]MDX2846442.1 hypothetical protein [Streptomyces ipomoeae]